MNEFPFHTFIRLVTFDRQIAQREQDALSKEKELTQIEEQLKQCTHALEQTKAVEHSAQKAVDMLELDAKTLDTRISKIRYNLDNVANPKEYASLNKELAKAQAEQQDLESSLLHAWNQLEGAKRDVQQAHTTYVQEHERITQQITMLEEEVAAYDADIETLYAQRAERLVGIPQEWIDKYETMRHRIANPVVPVQDKTCSGCGYIIPEQDLARTANRALIQCRHCFRFVYDKHHVQAMDL